MKRIILSITILALLGSCALHREYTRPTNLPTEGLLPTQTLRQTNDSLNFASIAWQNFFTDPHLRTLIEEVLKHNIDFKIAQERVKQAEANFRAARLAHLPSLSLSPSMSYTSTEGQQGIINYQAPTLLASWQVDVFGSIRNAKRRQKVMLESSEAYRQAVQSQLIATVARSYYTLVLLDEQLRTTEATEQLWGENVRAMRALFHAGVGNDAAVSMSEANYAQVRSSVLNIREQIREAEQSLNLLLSRPTGAIPRQGFSGWQSPSFIQIGTPLHLISARPDLRVAEANLRAATYAVSEARAAFYPQITLSGNAGWISQGSKIVTQPMDFVMKAVTSITQPLFQQGRLKAGYKVAQSKREEAELAFVRSILTAGVEVNAHLAKVQLYQAQAKLLAERTQALERSVKATKMLMESASSTYLEVLTAQEAFLGAQLQEISNRYNEIASTIALYQALGGGC